MPPNIKTPGPSNVPKDDSVTSAKIADGAIVNADVNAAAAIARTKLASGTASHVVINDDSGVLSSEATLAVTRGGTGAATAADARTNLELGGAAVLNVGTTAGTVAAGDDSRFPTADQKAALAGTSGAPGAANAFVTNADSRLSDQRTPSNGSVTLAKLAADALARVSPLNFDGTLADGQGWKRSGSLIVPASYVEEGDSAGGQVGGTFPTSLDVRGLRETGGPTLLTMGAVADGEYLKRDGSTLVGGTPAGGGGGIEPMYRPLTSPTLATRFMPELIGNYSTTSGILADTLYAFPLQTYKGMTLADISVYMYTPVAGGLLQLCVYDMLDTDYWPGALLGNQEVAVSSGTGWRDATVTAAVTGVVWLAALVNNASLRFASNAFGTGLFIGTPGIARSYGIKVPVSYGTPPGTFPTVGAAVVASSSEAPAIAFVPSAVTL